MSKLNKYDIKKYQKIGIIAAAVIAVAAASMIGINAMRGSGGASIDKALASVSTHAVSAADLRIAVVRMDEIQASAKVLVDLRKQKETFENRLREELTRTQQTLEREKTEIERSQDVLSRDALQRRVIDYQQRVSQLQRDISERAQSIEMEYQRALNEIQRRDLDPIIEGIIEKKNLSLVIDGRFARVSNNAPGDLDITSDVISALDKRVSTFKMTRPQGF